MKSKKKDLMKNKSTWEGKISLESEIAIRLYYATGIGLESPEMKIAVNSILDLFKRKDEK